MNGGHVNLFDIWARSMLFKNSDRVALCKAQLIASMAALWGHHSSRNLNPGLHTSMNVNGFDVDRTPVNVNNPDVDRNQTD